MNKIKVAIMSATTLMTASCTTHPILDKGTHGASTRDIVEKIRCETRDALISTLHQYIPKEKYTYFEEISPNEESRIKLYKTIDEKNQEKLLKYERINIIYGFTIDITSQAKNGLDLGLRNPFSNGARTMGLSASALNQNQNKRVFRISETTKDIMKFDFCSPKVSKKGKVLYPITGTIGIAEVLETFTSLNDNALLVEQDGSQKPTFVETMNFLTVLSGSLTPKITLLPANTGLDLAEAGYTNDILRTDNHQLAFSITIPTAAEAKLGNKSVEKTRERASNALNRQENLQDSQRNRLNIQELMLISPQGF